MPGWISGVSEAGAITEVGDFNGFLPGLFNRSDGQGMLRASGCVAVAKLFIPDSDGGQDVLGEQLEKRFVIVRNRVY